MKGVAIVVLAMIAMAQFMVQPSQAISCGDVDTFLSPCLAYLKSGGNPPTECCNGVKKLQAAAQTKPDRQAACACAKSAAAQMQIKQDAASSLPSKCGVTTNIPIDPNVDCSTIA